METTATAAMQESKGELQASSHSLASSGEQQAKERKNACSSPLDSCTVEEQPNSKVTRLVGWCSAGHVFATELPNSNNVGQFLLWGNCLT